MARRVALYNGQTWDMGDVDAQTFLDEALVPNFSDLRGAIFTERTDADRDEVIYEFSKRAGQKGLDD
mgnify:CR=1 FL=1